MNPVDSIFHHAALAPRMPAIASPDGLIPYGLLAQAINCAAANLMAMGVKTKDRVSIDIRNPMFHLIVCAALTRIGAASLSLQTNQMIDLSDIGVTRRLVDASATPNGFEATPITEQIFLQSPYTTPFANTIKGAHFAPDDLCRISLSSGTTGRPKAVGLTADIIDKRLSRSSTGGNDGAMSQRMLTGMGLSTAWGYMTLMRTLHNGGLVVFGQGPEDWLAMIEFFRVTDLVVSSDQMQALLAVRANKSMSLSSLRTVTICGSKPRIELVKQAQASICSQVILGYGSTEAGRIARASLEQFIAQNDCVGFPLPWLDLQIVRTDGQLCQVGEEGHVRMRGHCVVSGYMKPADEAGVFDNGYFYPGDLGYLRGDGSLCLTGRASARINRGGVKFAPELVEDALMALGVADCCVGAVEDASGGLSVIAGIVGEADLQQLQQALQTSLPKGLMPDSFIRITKVPRNQSGKIERANVATLLASHPLH